MSSQVCTLASLDCPLRCGLPGGREPPDGIKLYFKEIELFMRTMTLEAQVLKLPHHITITNSNTVITSKSSGSWRPPPFLKNPRLTGFASTTHSFPSTLHNLFIIRMIDNRVIAIIHNEDDWQKSDCDVNHHHDHGRSIAKHHNLKSKTKSLSSHYINDG